MKEEAGTKSHEISDADIIQMSIIRYGWEGIDPRSESKFVRIARIESGLLPLILGPVRAYEVHYRRIEFLSGSGPIMGASSCIVSNKNITFIHNANELSKHIAKINPNEIDKSQIVEIAGVISQLLGLRLKERKPTADYPWILEHQSLDGEVIKITDMDKFISEDLWQFAMSRNEMGEWDISFAAVSSYFPVGYRFRMKICNDGGMSIARERRLGGARSL
jgi:hypothetical protein